jgi:hypothetical protein
MVFKECHSILDQKLLFERSLKNRLFNTHGFAKTVVILEYFMHNSRPKFPVPRTPALIFFSSQRVFPILLSH